MSRCESKLSNAELLSHDEPYKFQYNGPMHVSTKPLKEYPFYLRPFFWSQKWRYGQVLIPGLLWGRVPRLFSAVALLYGAIDRKKSPIEPALRSLITVRVSQINWCTFCVDINSATLQKRGVSLEKIAALSQWKDSQLFSEREKLALEYTDAVTYSDQQVSPELMVKLKQHFDEDALIDLTALIAFQNLSSKFNAALDVPPQGFCHKPQSTP